ncbi:MAG: asparagine synthase (glutamine-hydrolyzing) [Eubacteriales bacterium]|nr:asparagine synthase (glutamine-hydrolyzing) [Eubacteriales bacterium]
MCGICGYMSRRTITREELTAMNDTMIHRGPNDSGAELYEASGGYTVGLAQRRLSILDLSPLGHQPMHAAGGRVSVVFNGEIYNFQELKRELSDYPFRSNCDTEVILAAYLKWGIDCVKRLNGMFAIALFDRQTQELILVRDRIGKKPLYYWLDGENIVFASECKPLLRCPGFSREIRRDVLSRYLYQQYINAPESIFENVWKVEPGAVVTFRAGQVSARKYWDIAEIYAAQSVSPVQDYEEAKAGLKERLQKATAQRMIADVPLGSFLSGGYDSSLISALAQEQSAQPLKTFSIGFKDPKYDESVYAEAVAKHLGTDHTSLCIDEPEMFDLVASIPQYFDEPFADSSQIPTMLVSALARRSVTVALSGDGGDEFYCGYNIYENVRQAQQLDALGALAHAAGQLPIGGGRRLEERYPFRVRVVAANRDPETKTQFGAGSYVTYAQNMVLAQEEWKTGKTKPLPVNYPFESRYGVSDWQVRRMLLDMDTYLPGDILCKVDRASMKYSLEARCPILDTGVMEYSFRIPQAFKFRNGEKKAILKDIAYDYIPRELLERPKKGFGVPLDTWLRGPLRAQLTDYANRDFLKRQGLFDADFVSKMIGDYLEKGDGGPATGANFSKLSWSFFVFEQWWEKIAPSRESLRNRD